MAKKNGRDDPPKPQVAENEQMSDIILIWKSHATLTLLATQDCPLWLQYD